MAYMGKESKREWIYIHYIYITDTLFAAHLKLKHNIINQLYSNKTNIKTININAAAAAIYIFMYLTHIYLFIYINTTKTSLFSIIRYFQHG